MKRLFLITMPIFLAFTFFLSSCGKTDSSSNAETSATAPPATSESATQTPDLCSPGNIEAEVNKVHQHMREFDDASVIAANVPRDQLSNAIADLQRIRREAEDQPIPSCLSTLKTYQLAHMNTVINTLVGFLGGTDQSVVDQGIALARQQHDQYTLELARILGLTVVPADSLLTPEATSTP